MYYDILKEYKTTREVRASLLAAVVLKMRLERYRTLSLDKIAETFTLYVISIIFDNQNAIVIYLRNISAI